MWVYGDRSRTADPRDLLADVEAGLERVRGMPPGLERHAGLVGASILAGELAQGLADAGFEAAGQDDLTPVQTAAMNWLTDLARAVAASWRSRFADLPALPSPDTLAALALPAEVATRTGEGYAFYAVYPEGFLEAAGRAGFDRPPTVIGLRSIGTGLAAMVAAATGAEPPITLRPSGHPFRREIRLSPALEAHLRARASGRFAVVDEGPGLSGSSMGAVGDLLQRLGVPEDRIDWFPSHRGDLGPQADPRRRARWSRARRHVVDFDALCLAGGAALPLETWFEDITGPALEPLRDLSGGAWRALRPDGADLPAHGAMERRKSLLTAARGRFLLKFAGLGPEADAKLARARALHAEGFTPEPLALRHGFLLEPWIEGARPLDPKADRPALLAHLARYLAFRARAFPAGPHDGASPDDLAEMIRVNVSEALDTGAGDALSARFCALIGEAPPLCPVHVDGRLHAWEWLRTPEGRILKTDALDHSNAHDLVGCQCLGWDLAGVTVELELSPSEAENFRRMIETRADVSMPAARVEAYRLAYGAFQLALWSCSADAGAVARASGYRALLGTLAAAPEVGRGKSGHHMRN